VFVNPQIHEHPVNHSTVNSFKARHRHDSGGGGGDGGRYWTGMLSLLTLPAAEFQRAYCYWSGQRYLNMHEYLEATQQR
jgi:hypothetical protein